MFGLRWPFRGYYKKEAEEFISKNNCKFCASQNTIFPYYIRQNLWSDGKKLVTMFLCKDCGKLFQAK